MDFEDITGIADLDTVSEESVWQNFERLAASIFGKNNFGVGNFILRGILVELVNVVFHTLTDGNEIDNRSARQLSP